MSDTSSKPRSSNVNSRLVSVKAGFERSIAGREDLIRANAADLAKKLDQRTSGRHHNKIYVALRALDAVINAFGEKDDDSQPSAKRFQGMDRARSSKGDGANSSKASRADRDADDLGEFTAKRSAK